MQRNRKTLDELLAEVKENAKRTRIRQRFEIMGKTDDLSSNSSVESFSNAVQQDLKQPLFYKTEELSPREKVERWLMEINPSENRRQTNRRKKWKRIIPLSSSDDDGENSINLPKKNKKKSSLKGGIRVVSTDDTACEDVAIESQSKQKKIVILSNILIKPPDK